MSERASNAVRVSGPVHSLVRIEIMSVCCGNIHLQCRVQTVTFKKYTAKSYEPFWS